MRTEPAIPSRQAVQARTASKPGKVTGKLKAACDAIVHEAKPWNEAAVQAGLTVRSMRLALERPHVLAYLRTAKEVLRQSLCAANPRRLAELRDQSANPAAAVRAAVALEQLVGGVAAPGSAVQAPGLVIVVMPADAPRNTVYEAEKSARPVAAAPMIDITPPIQSARERE